MNGGYIMIYKSSKKIYLELFACLTLGKPILWYEDKNTCFFIDTISGGEISTEIVDDEEVRTYGDIILTKGGMTITITAENVVSEVGEIQPSSGSSVVANPILSGDEDALSGLEVDGVKYAVASGGKTLYNHNVYCTIGTIPGAGFVLRFVLEKSTEITDSDMKSLLYNNGLTSTSAYLNVTDYTKINLTESSYVKMIGVYSNGSTLQARIDNNGTTQNPGFNVVRDRIIPSA